MTLKAGTVFLVLLALGAASCVSLAKRVDRQQVIRTYARLTSVDDGANGVTTLTGQVKIMQGSLVITGDTATLYYDADQQMSRAVVTGRPAHIQQLDEQDRLVQADADTLDYDNIQQIAVLARHAVVKMEGQGEVRGDKLTYHLGTTELKGEGGDNGLVHGVILPRYRTAPANQ